MHPEMSMSPSKCPYDNVKMCPVDNGHKITYYEKSPSVGGGNYEHVEMTHKEFVFSEKDVKKAFAKYKEICDCIMSYSKQK